MSLSDQILRRSLAKPFYRENAGAFVFLFTVMFFVVGHLNGAGLFEYHYSLALGILSSWSVGGTVAFVWLLYAIKCLLFVDQRLLRPELSYLRVYCLLDRRTQFYALLKIDGLLLLPVLLYGVWIGIVGMMRQVYIPAFGIILYLLALLFGAAAWHLRRLEPLHGGLLIGGRQKRSQRSVSYVRLLLQYMAYRQKWMWAAVKLFTCMVFYGIARNNTVGEYDSVSVFVFFNFGVLANGILLHRVKDFEDFRMSWYRGLPVSEWNRWLGYVLFCWAMLLPELLTAWWLTPVHLHYIDALVMIGSSHSLLLLLYSILSWRLFSRKEYLYTLLLVGAVQYLCLSAGLLIPLCGLFYAGAYWIFVFSLRLAF